jgi:hypothetical protein
MKRALLCLLAMAVFSTAGFSQVAHWPLDTDTRDIVGISHGTPSLNGVSFVDDAQRGAVMQLDGVEGIVTLPSDLLKDMDNATFSCWFNFGGGAYWQAVWSFGHINDPWAMFRLNPRTGLGDGGTLGVTVLGFTRNWRDWWTEDPIDTLTWYFACGVFDADTFRFYLNDSLIFRNDSVPTTPNEIMTDPNEAYLGKSHWEDPTLNGMIDDVRLYDHALSEAEVLELYHSTNTSAPVIQADPELIIWAYDGRIYYGGVDAAGCREVRVYSVTGQLLFLSENLEELREVTFDPGLYVVSLSGDKGLISKKVMIPE